MNDSVTKIMRANAAEARAGQTGFSMVEVLVATVVTGVLATSAFYFLSAQSGIGARGNDMMKGANLGKLKMDSLKVAAYSDLSSGSDTVSARFIRAWNVSLMRDDAGLPNGRKKIELTVYWPFSGDHAVSLISIKSDDKYKDDAP